MKTIMNIIIASLGFSTALWIFSKAVLNIVKASNLWAGIYKPAKTEGFSNLTPSQELKKRFFGSFVD